MELTVYILKVIYDNVEMFGTRDGETISIQGHLAGALAFSNIVSAAYEMQYYFRDKYRGDVWLEEITLERYYHVEKNKLVFDERIYKALKVA